MESHLRPLRVLHTPCNEANNPFGLSQAERKLGIDSQLIIFYPDGYFDTADKTIFTKNRLLNEFRRWAFIINAMCNYDVIHYNNGSFLTPRQIQPTGRNKWLRRAYNYFYARFFEGLDLKIASKLRKKIFVTFQGSDGRIIGFCKKNYQFHFSKEEDAIHTEHDDESRMRIINLFSMYADGIFTVNPDLLNTLPDSAEFIPYSSVAPNTIIPTFPHRRIDRIHIVHAPSNPQVKGTKYLLKALNLLKEKGFDFDFTLVTGMTNQEALCVYQKADLIVDQLLAGWYGGFAVEAMAMGKPVIAYIREYDLVHIPPQMRAELPIIRANPENVFEVLRKILSDKGKGLRETGMRSRDYVCNWHDPNKVANKLVSYYRAPKAGKPNS